MKKTALFWKTEFFPFTRSLPKINFSKFYMVTQQLKILIKYDIFHIFGINSLISKNYSNIETINQKNFFNNFCQIKKNMIF